MDLDILPKCLDYTRRRKKWLLLLAAFGVSGYGVYKLYNSPSIVKKRKKFVKLIGTIISLIELVADSTETISLVSNDLKQFLQSDSDEIPRSLKQISKIATSDEFQQSLTRVTQALTVGVLRGYYDSATKDDSPGPGLPDRVLDKLFTKAGSGFASVVVGSFARNLVLGFYQESGASNSDDTMHKWVGVLCNDKCKEMMGDCIQSFVSTAVAVYLDKTMDINTYEELFAGLTNPKHGTKVADIMVSLCNGAVETLVRTSHQVMTSSNAEMLNSKPTTSFSSHEEGFEIRRRDGGKENGWVDSVSSTLAVPRNRSFVLDVTGRVTSETVTSFLDFVLYKMLDGLSRSFSVVHEEVVQVFRYVGAKSAAILTFCFAFCLHLVGGTRVLMPA